MSDLTINHFFSTPVFIFMDNIFQENVEQLLKDIYEWRDNDTVDLVRSARWLAYLLTSSGSKSEDCVNLSTYD